MHDLRADVPRMGPDAAMMLDRERNEYLRVLTQWRHEDAKLWAKISDGQDRVIDLLAELAKEMRKLRQALGRRS